MFIHIGALLLFKNKNITTHNYGEFHSHGSKLSDFILGSQDGLVNVLGIILGVSVATTDVRIIFVAGLAALGAESISMGAVAYTSTLARRKYYLNERGKDLSY